MRLFFSILLVALLQAAAFAQIVMSNPGLPPSENFVYSEKVGNRVTPFKQSVVFKTENGRSYYETQSFSVEQDLLYRVDAKDFLGFYSETTDRSPDATVRRIWELQQSYLKAKTDELVISDFNSLPFSLRAFPWGKVSYAKLVFMGTASAMSAYQFELRVTGKETVKAGGKSYECWRTELSLAGILGGLVPKTVFWYNIQAPNYLVKFEGSQGGPGSPTRTLELVSYNSAN